MSRKVIQFEHVGKQYRLGTIGTGTLSQDLNRWWARLRGKDDPYLKVGETNDRTQRGTSGFVWALRDIDFSVEQGDVVGIIGKNGAGKSTLLKILSRVTSPTVGRIGIKGRIASLLEVGTGFHPEMTGRENIFMNGSIMGMTKAEIRSKLDEIVDFAGVAKYLDTPVKRYSSGMMVRLGFAIAAHLEPEILVVDEVLAVGDAEFQKKAIGKMQDVSKGEGRTVLFVSHNMGAVKNLCKRGIVLNQGQVAFDGGVEEAVKYYTNKDIAKKNWRKQICDESRLNPTKDVQFLMVELSKQTCDYSTEEPIEFIFDVFANLTVNECRINLTIYTLDGTPIGSVSNYQTFSIKKAEKKRISITLFNHNLAKGLYNVAFSVGVGNFATGQNDFDYIINPFILIISSSTKRDYVQWDKSWGNINFSSQTKVLK